MMEKSTSRRGLTQPLTLTPRTCRSSGGTGRPSSMSAPARRTAAPGPSTELAAARGAPSVALRRTCSCACGLDLAVSGRGLRHQALQQHPSSVRDRPYGFVERLLIGCGRPGHATNLAHVLHRGSLDLVVGHRRFEVVQYPNIPAHTFTMPGLWAREQPRRGWGTLGRTAVRWPDLGNRTAGTRHRGPGSLV
jgi:hypothetical protein